MRFEEVQILKIEHLIKSWDPPKLIKMSKNILDTEKYVRILELKNVGSNLEGSIGGGCFAGT